MQLILPIYPEGTHRISDRLGFFVKDKIVQYIANGLPVYSHASDNLNAFRYITSNFIHQGLCRKIDIERAFKVSTDSVTRAYNKFKKEGEQGFFGEDGRKGRAYKITGEVLDRIQSKLNKGQSNNSIAREEGLRESAIRYHITQGNLKKKNN